jgi:drug/metabolite transporter (DMT)-like permease
MRWNLAVAALASSWGFIAVIVAAVDLDAAVLVFYRVAIAAAAIAIVLAAIRRLQLLRPDWRVLVVGVFLAGHWFLFFETIKVSSVAVALLTVYTAPIFLALLAPVFLPERRSGIALLALAPAGGGLALIALLGGEDSDANATGIATGLGAAISYAGLVIATKRLTARLPVVTITFWSYATAAATLAPFLVLTGRVLPHGDEVGYVALLGAVFTALSGFVYVSLLRKVTAQAIGILAYLEVVSSALLAWAILDQSLGWAVLAGGALVVAGGALVVVYEPADAAPVEVSPVGLRGEQPARP